MLSGVPSSLTVRLLLWADEGSALGVIFRSSPFGSQFTGVNIQPRRAIPGRPAAASPGPTPAGLKNHPAIGYRKPEASHVCFDNTI